tara:strand:+ start:526 stop:2343 length:1818 start_codon:yes stop_codon:yes gene_type:complete
MAQNENIFTRLGKLFQNQIVVRKTPSGQVKVKDVDFSQTSLSTNFIDRYNRLFNSQNASWGTGYAAKQNSQNAYDAQRRELFRDYEVMDSDPIISSALDIYSDESTVDNVEGRVLKIKTDNPKVHKILHNLFYDILNIEFNLWPWIRNMTKYGDFFLKLDILDKHGIMNVRPLSVYETNRLEEHDLEDPRKVEFQVTEPQGKYKATNGETNEELFQNYEIAHFRLYGDANFLPYGKSMLEGARKVWKQLTLMEDAMLIHRIMRAPEKRVFKLDIGNIPPNEVENFMQQVINKMKKIPVIDQNTGEYNLRYNVESVTEDYFLPVRGGDSGTEIDTLPGLGNDNAIDDIEYLRNKMMAALKVPKAFLGYDEQIGSKATLAAEDVRFARTIERLQKVVCAELEKIAIVHLYTQGFEDAELINFDLELTNPSMIHQQEKLELLTQQQEIATNLLENKLMSRKWIYDNIFEFDDNQKTEIFDGIIEDTKQKFRMEQIETEGSDPANQPQDSGEGEEDVMARKGEWGGDRRSGTGKKEYGNEYDADDLKDATKYERERYGKREFKGKSPLAVGKGGTIVARESLLKSLKKKFGNNINQGILNEDSIIDEEK